ncbi:MAG TPA: BlaI/MecI/CopY family transcriptional regulator [Pirellulales bacterium]|nr:BlaI/MecI/CopY family transcriptional regulator [Pirellulales bacterium]
MPEPQLPDAELEVMACLWKHGAMSARQVREAMAAYRPMTHAAVSTLLKRLQDKGMAAREKGPVGKAFLFRAAVPPRRTYRRIVAELTERIFGGNGLALVSTLFETHPPTAEQIDELQRLVDRHRPGRKPRRKRS